jgi:hypothetical protein
MEQMKEILAIAPLIVQTRGVIGMQAAVSSAAEPVNLAGLSDIPVSHH